MVLVANQGSKRERWYKLRQPMNASVCGLGLERASAEGVSSMGERPQVVGVRLSGGNGGITLGRER